MKPMLLAAAIFAALSAQARENVTTCTGTVLNEDGRWTIGDCFVRNETAQRAIEKVCHPFGIKPETCSVRAITTPDLYIKRVISVRRL